MSKQKLTQVVALGALTCSTFGLSTSVMAAAPSAALSGVDSSTIINSAVSQNQNNTGSATGQSQAGIGFEDGDLWLISAPNFNFGTRIVQVDQFWKLAPNKSESSNSANKQDDYKDDSIVVGDFRSPRDNTGVLILAKSGWTLTAQVTDFKLKTSYCPNGDPNKPTQPIKCMNFNSARLLHGSFKGSITEDAIKNKQFDLEAATNDYPGAPTNNIVGTDSGTNGISIAPGRSGTTIWSAQSKSIQGKSIWGLAFNSEKDVDLETSSLGSQLTGDYIAKLTWTLSTVPVT